MAGAKNSLKLSRKIEKTQSSTAVAAKANHPHIPHEIVHDILLKLPVKSLLRFKAVCKPWCSLISGPQFVKARKGNGCRLVFLETIPCLDPTSRNFYLTPLISNFSSDGKVFKSEDFPYVFQTPISEYWGSCNGLFFMRSALHPFYFLWNPSTGVNKTITGIGHSITNGKYITGLSYNSSIDKYKAILAINEYQRLRLYVSNSKFDHFNYIEYGDFPYLPNDSNTVGVTVNGAPHWVMKNIGSVRVIIYFDCVVDRFKEVPLPDSPLGAKSELISLADLGGCLCAVVSRESHVDVWVMKEHGVKQSWTQLFAIQQSGLVQGYYLKILGFTKGGDDVVLMQINQRGALVAYNLKTGKMSSEWLGVLWSSGQRYEYLIVMYQENYVSFSNLLT